MTLMATMFLKAVCPSKLILCIDLMPTENIETPVVIFCICFSTEWQQKYMDPNDCLITDPMEKCDQNNYTSTLTSTSTLQPTVTTRAPTSNLTSNSTNNGNR